MDKFNIMLSRFIENLDEDPKTEDFGKYFKNEWFPIKEQWAKCYRIGSGINTNMFVESFHKTLKYDDNYFSKKQGKRIDKCLSILLQYSKDMAKNRLVKLTKGKTTWKSSEIFQKHKMALELPKNVLEKTSAVTWEVKSQKTIDADTTRADNLKYKVEKQTPCQRNCKIKCKFCDICLHSYSCNCPDGLTATTICKHVHLVVIADKGNSSADHNSYNENGSRRMEEFDCPDQTETHTNDEKNEISEIFKEINPDSKDNMETIKKKLLHKHMLLLEKINKCEDRTLLLAARNHINNACNTLDLTTTTSNSAQEMTRPGISRNKNVEVQRKFFSTTKKRNPKRKKYSKPNMDEKIDIENEKLHSKNT